VDKSLNLAQHAPTQLSWLRFLREHEIEKKKKDLFRYLKQGYSGMQKLHAYIDLTMFLITERVVTIVREPVFLAISEQLLAILEDETEKYDFYSQPSEGNQQYFAPGITSLQSMKYQKLEKDYISYNQVHDPYSHSLYPHHLLAKKHFEKEELEKRERIAKEIEEREFSSTTDKQLLEEISEDDRNRQKQLRRESIDRYIKKMLSQPSTRQNLPKMLPYTYKYSHHFYELFPNHKAHSEVYCKCLYLLCEIITERDMHAFLKERQQAFFDHIASQGQPHA